MQLFCAWLSWSRFRVVAPAWVQTLGTLVFHVWTPHCGGLWAPTICLLTQSRNGDDRPGISLAAFLTISLKG
jgi:hypothetical protein